MRKPKLRKSKTSRTRMDSTMAREYEPAMGSQRGKRKSTRAR